MSTLINLAGGGGLATGIIGIPDGAGWYTFYASLDTAMTAAVSGDTIVFFDDYTETATGNIALKDGVDINLNGHTYTFDKIGTESALIATAAGAVSCTFYNASIYADLKQWKCLICFDRESAACKVRRSAIPSPGPS